MGFKQQTKKIKRSLIQRITRNQVPQNPGTKEQVKKVLITRPNHRLGNLLLITPLIQEVTELFPGCQIDVFVSGHHAPILYKEYSNIKRIISTPRKPGKDFTRYADAWTSLQKQKYDLVINADTGSSSGRISAVFANAPLKFISDDQEGEILKQYSDGEHFAKFPVYSLRKFLRNLGWSIPVIPVPVLDLKLSPTELENGRKILHGIVPADKKTICIFTNATGEKCLSETWWQEFYSKLKTSLPDFQIMEVLPVENISKIGFQAPSYYSRDTREMGAVISNTSAFISGDCGVMHLASASKTPTLGLFNKGRMDKYRPYGNKSTAVDTNLATHEEIIGILKEQMLS